MKQLTLLSGPGTGFKNLTEKDGEPVSFQTVLDKPYSTYGERGNPDWHPGEVRLLDGSGTRYGAEVRSGYKYLQQDVFERLGKQAKADRWRRKPDFLLRIHLDDLLRAHRTAVENRTSSSPRATRRRKIELLYQDAKALLGDPEAVQIMQRSDTHLHPRPSIDGTPELPEGWSAPEDWKPRGAWEPPENWGERRPTKRPYLPLFLQGQETAILRPLHPADGDGVAPVKTRELLERILHICEVSLEHDSPTPGRPQEPDRLDLMMMLCITYRNYSGRKPSSKQDGPFDRFLRIVCNCFGDPLPQSNRKSLLGLVKPCCRYMEHTPAKGGA